LFPAEGGFGPEIAGTLTLRKYRKEPMQKGLKPLNILGLKIGEELA